MEERGSSGRRNCFFIFGERLFSGNEALPAKEKCFLDFVKWFSFWSVAPPARGAGGIPTSPLCPPGPPIPPSNGRGIPPDPPCTERGTSPCLLTDRGRIGHAIWFGLGPATNRMPRWARTLHGPGAEAILPQGGTAVAAPCLHSKDRPAPRSRGRDQLRRRRQWPSQGRT